jgi:anti-anti-sigma factor
VTVTVADGGTWHPPAAAPGFRGRGLQIINTLAGDVELHHGGTGTFLRFRLPSARAAGAGIPSPAARGPAAPEPPAVEQPAAVATVRGAEGRRVELTGDLDLAGVTAVCDDVLARLADGDQPVLLDLGGLGFGASVGVGLLLEAVRTARAHRVPRVRLPPSGPARRALDITGLTDVLESQPGSG